jgi:two-component system, chemotaxis family, protein-glutamate methylesterase/glutaminase
MVDKIRVLVVDDSSFFRTRIRQELERTGEIEVAGEAVNGAEAVRQAASLRPDLITMDVAMPVMDGISAVREIMRASPTAVVMFSALTRDGAKATLEALEAGAVDFFPSSPAPWSARATAWACPSA